MASPFLLTVLDAESKAIATFRAGGPVARDLVAAITAGVEARLPTILATVQAQGRWWIRPDHFDAAVESALAASIPPVVTDAVKAVLLDLKLEVTEKHIGGSTQ